MRIYGWGILVEALRGRGVPVFQAKLAAMATAFAEIEKKMPKLKTHTGAKKRFSKTGTGKIKRGQTKTRHILTSKSPKVKRKLGTDPARFRRRLREGSAHDSLRLIAAHVRDLWIGLQCHCGNGPLTRAPARMRNAFAAARDQA